jgi:HEAT repeat protein
MQRIPNVSKLSAARDLQGLAQALRYGPDVRVRLQAARAAGELCELELTEPLVRSFLEDPDGEVRQEAHAALLLTLGNQAEQVIATYTHAEAYAEPWVMQEPLPRDGGEEESGALMPLVEALKKKKDLGGLEDALRCGKNTRLRLDAARAMGDLLAFDRTENLVRSFREDPQLEVRLAARSALDQLFGTRAVEVIASYGDENNDPQPWIVEELPASLSGLLEEGGTAGTGQGQWDDSSLSALLAIVRDDRDRAKRVKAVQALGKIHTIMAVEVLIRLAQQSEDEEIIAAAREALSLYYGEETDAMLEAYMAEGDADAQDLDDEEDEEDDDEEGEEDDGWSEEETPAFTTRGRFEDTAASPASPYDQRSSVVQEEKAGLGSYVMIGVTLLVVIVIVIYLAAR